MITRTNEYCGTSIYQLAPDFLDAVGRGITGQKSAVLAFEESEGTSIANLLNIRNAKMQLKLFSNHNHVSNVQWLDILLVMQIKFGQPTSLL